MKRDELIHDVRQRLKRLPPPHDNHYGVVPLPPPENGIGTTDVAQRHRRAVEVMAKVDALTAEIGDPYLVSRVLTRREAVSSSSIEGTNSTLDELLSIEETGDDQAKSAAKQVRDYALVLDKVLPEAARLGDAVFSRELIRNLHAAIVGSDPDYKDVPGALRDAVVWIGGNGNIAYSTWTPPPPEDVGACLAETVDYLRNEGMQQMHQDLVVRMAIGHAHFEAVHPFRDGNGRVGRILLPLMMAASGRVPLYLSPYIDAHKAEYYAALKGAQQRLAWEKMVGFISDAIVETVGELMVTRRALSTLREEWLHRRRFRKASAALRTVDVLPHFPVVTAPRLAKMLSVSLPQAIQAIDQLVAVDILKERTGYSRNRVFAAADVLAIVNRPFGSEPEVPVDYGEEQRRRSLGSVSPRPQGTWDTDSGSSLDGDPRKFAREYVYGLPEYRS